MKIIKRLLPVLFSLLLVLALSMLCGCSRTDSSDAEEVLKSELDQLKNLDSDTTQKYISYTEMFPDATENVEQPCKKRCPGVERAGKSAVVVYQLTVY